ncbi:MAG TPA: DUF3800 domain-containing protein [Blastocatellia bacterium]|nr:DUF3800 domain-containing protein [Blastocatellia bacterium]
MTTIKTLMCSPSVRRYSAVEHLVSKTGGRFIMPLTAYFDETGHSRDPQVNFVGMAGLAASAEKWEAFENEWAELLEEYGVPSLHMKEFAHGRGAFEGWAEVRRRRFLGQAIEIILNTGGMPVGAIVDLRAYRQLDARVQEHLRDPYYMCLNVCVHGALVYGLFNPLAEQPFSYSGEKINIVFDQNHEFAGLVPSFMSVLEKRPLYNGQVGGYTFSSSMKQMPLQAADFIAYEMGRTFKNLIAGRPPMFSWGLRRIFELSWAREIIPWFVVYEAKTLKHIESRMLNKLKSEGREGDDLSA